MSMSVFRAISTMRIIRIFALICLIFASIRFAPPAQAAAPTSGLVGYWNFNEVSGTTAADSSGNGNNGTLTPTAGGPTWTTGRIGNGALAFDGVDDQVNIPDSSSLADLPNGAFSVSAWINRTDSASNNDYILSKSHGSASAGWEIQVNNARRAVLTMQRATTDMIVRSGNNTTPASGWFHVVWVYAGGDTASNSHIYINGTEASSYVNADGSGTYQSDSGRIAKIGANGFNNRFTGS